MGKLLNSIVLHVSLGFNLLLENKKSRTWWSRIDEHIVIGALPFQNKNHMEMLLSEEHIGAVVTMNQSYELQKNCLGIPLTPQDWKDIGIPFCLGTTDDFSAPSIETIERCVQFIHEYVTKDTSVYVHCKAGKGRSVVIVICYFIKFEKLSFETAFDKVKTKRNHVKLTISQEKRAKEYFNICNSIEETSLTKEITSNEKDKMQEKL